MSLRFPNGAFARDQTFSRDKLDAVIMALDRSIHALELTKIDWLQQVTLFQTNALKRVADAVQPIINQLRSAQQGGFLVAETPDLVEIVDGEELSFFIPADARIAWRPTPFLAILAPDEREDWAIGRVLLYNEVSGLLTVEILHLNGSGAERTGWTVAASSGVTEAVYQWMTDTKAARDQVIEARDQVMQALADVNAAAILIANGPVSTVNGKTGGVITLVKADIGLGNVDNTSDANKPISSAVGTALNALSNAIELKADSATMTAALSDKADKATTYTKTDVDNLLVEQIHAMSLVI